MEIIIKHVNRSLNVIKSRDKHSKGTRRQTPEKSVKAKLSQSSKKPQRFNSQMTGDTTRLRVSPWKNILTMTNSLYSKYCFSMV